VVTCQGAINGNAWLAYVRRWTTRLFFVSSGPNPPPKQAPAILFRRFVKLALSGASLRASAGAVNFDCAKRGVERYRFCEHLLGKTATTSRRSCTHKHEVTSLIIL
jgi:hypothetical protein